MCGICGFTGEVKDREETLASMMQAIRHRGPDDRGTYFDGRAALGFQRLSIVDLEAGAQPMKNETGDLALVFNGEIYNDEALRTELLAAGHAFRTRCDSEVLLHGYEEWGEGMLPRLRGMFAFVIWDGKKEELFASRDFFGIKPFYYFLKGRSFVFASEIKAILRHPTCEARLNEEALEQFLSFQYSALEESFFQGVYRLEPGSWLRYRPGSAVLELHRYFEPKLAPEPEGGRGEEEWVSEVEQALDDSIRLHSRADVEVGAFLSGGVDSALTAKKFGGKRAYTVGFGSESCAYNEMAKARETAEECGLSHKGRRIGEEEFWEAVPQVLYYMDEPLGDASAVALYFLAREAAGEVKAVVSGEGADELFGGYRIYCEPEALRRWQLLPLGFRKYAAALARRLPDWKGKQFLIRGSKSVEERFIGNANIFSDEERRELLKSPSKAESPEKFLAEDYADIRRRDTKNCFRDADRMQEIDLRRWLPGDILQKADRMSMAHSLEVRVPYLDRQVFETARKLPGAMKQRGRVTKYALRRAAARALDSAACERPKLGFPVPIRVWMRQDAGYERLREAFSGRAARKYFHPEVLRRLLEEHRSGRKDNSRKLWTVYTFCVWYEIYF